MPILTLLSALSISGVAIFYSVIGLATIFPGAFWPVVIMGSVLEVGKLITASWVYRNWKFTPWLLKSYLVIAVIILSFITSMGIFGFLSKAHLEQNLAEDTVTQRIEIINSKISQEEIYIERQKNVIERAEKDLNRTSSSNTEALNIETQSLKDAEERFQTLLAVETNTIKELNARMTVLDKDVSDVLTSNKQFFNEERAAASTVAPARVKLAAFAVSGGMAAFAGGLLVSVVPSLEPSTTFAAVESIQVVVIAIIGGLGSIAGPILGSLWVRGLPEVTPDELLDLQRLFTSNIGLLVLLMYFPGGLLQIVYTLRDKLLDRAEDRLADTEVASTSGSATPTARSRGQRAPVPDGVPALAATDIRVRFGGNVAVDGVTFSVAPGELVGLIGTNGAGKSTLLNAISGFVPSTGTVEVHGTDITSLDAAGRHRVGLGRGFQAARLYPDLTVREGLQVALEARRRSPFVASMLGVPPSPARERAKRAEADEIIDYLGLGRYADQATGNLSTGTRRIVELGSLLAVDAQVLLLDEPTGGVAQRETEAFGPLIKRIQAELDAAVVVIEHDMPLVMSISDRVYCLESGIVIAEGPPEQVRQDDAVIASYLGTDERAIQRSDS